MSGFYNPLAGGAIAAKGTGTGGYGPFGRGPKYEGLTDSQKLLGAAFHGTGLKGPLGDMYDYPSGHRGDMKIHSFENKYVPNTSSSREYIPPEYQGEYKSLLSDWDQPHQLESTGGVDDPNRYFRGKLRIYYHFLYSKNLHL